MAGMVTQLEFASRVMQAGTGPDPIANRQAAYVRRNVYSQLKRAKGVCMQTILGTHAAFLACRLARKKAPELRSVSEACLASLVAHDMAEFRTRNANLGKLVCEKCRRYASRGPTQLKEPPTQTAANATTPAARASISEALSQKTCDPNIIHSLLLEKLAQARCVLYESLDAASTMKAEMTQS